MLSQKTSSGTILPAASIKALMEGVLNHKSLFRFQAKGFSMSPFIKDGDIITVAPLNNRKLVRGDVVAFSYPPHQPLVIHRIVDQERNSFILKGDIFPKDQAETIPSENILGIVSCVERNGKNAPAAIGKIKGCVAFASSQGWWAILNEIWKLIQLGRHKI